MPPAPGVEIPLGVPREAEERLAAYAKAVIEENGRQNLVARTTISVFWDRHISDSLQLVPLLLGGTIVDIGSGAGLPGIVIACVSGAKVILVEPRKRRAEFLTRVTDDLGLADRVSVRQAKIEAISDIVATTIVARAVASLPRLLEAASHISTDATRWVLPKGRSARSELEDAAKSWQGKFELIGSATDPEASIIVAERVRRRA